MNVDHDLVSVDEFDALAIELKASAPSSRRAEPPASDSEPAGGSRPMKQWVWKDIGKYPAKTHARKVAKELDAKNGLIYLVGEEDKRYRDSDLSFAFRQRRYFYYLSGANFAACSVTYDLALDKLILWIPCREPRDVLWYGTIPSIEDCKTAADLDDVRPISGLARYLQKTLSSSSSTSTTSSSSSMASSAALSLPPSSHSLSAAIFTAMSTTNSGGRTTTTTTTTSISTPKTVFVLHPDQAPQLKTRGGHALHVDTARLRPAMDAARVVKTPHEVALVRRANAVTSAAHTAVLRGLRGLANEREVDALFRAHCSRLGAPVQAYPVMAGSGPAAASTLHYAANDAPLAGKATLVLDAGCEWKCYASDVTRTLPLTVVDEADDDDGLDDGLDDDDGRQQRRKLRSRYGFSPEAKAIYGIVEHMQAECMALMRPGTVFVTVHLHACKVAISELLRLGILRGGTVDDIFKRGTVAAFFPHGLGHHLGLEPHDSYGRERLLPRAPIPPMGKRAVVGSDLLASMIRFAAMAPLPYTGYQKLKPGMIVTIEPGIYFSREYIEAFFLKDPQHAKYIDTDVLDRYWDVGGVRLEDDILIVENGCRNLTKVPKGEEMIKIINGDKEEKGAGHESV